jgi:putative transposase
VAKKKVQATRSVDERRTMVDADSREVSRQRQCELLGISRSTSYYQKTPATSEDEELMKLIDIIYLKSPYYGARKISKILKIQGRKVGRKKVRTLMRLMGIQAIYQRPRTSEPNPEHKIYPYLLRNMRIDKPNQVWCTDITYIRLKSGWAYLMAVMDWHSRRVISWGLSSTMDTDFCVKILNEALMLGKPEIFNTDQGSQFTSREFTEVLKTHEIKISMDGKGRFMDNIFVERLWRSVKYECIFLHDLETIRDAQGVLKEYFISYNLERPHESLGYKTPDQIWSSAA